MYNWFYQDDLFIKHLNHTNEIRSFDKSTLKPVKKQEHVDFVNELEQILIKRNIPYVL